MKQTVCNRCGARLTNKSPGEWGCEDENVVILNPNGETKSVRIDLCLRCWEARKKDIQKVNYKYSHRGRM